MWLQSLQAREEAGQGSLTEVKPTRLGMMAHQDRKFQVVGCPKDRIGLLHQPA
jgi:hypothetical protein